MNLGLSLDLRPPTTYSLSFGPDGITLTIVGKDEADLIAKARAFIENTTDDAPGPMGAGLREGST